jgi:hypothetical protein
MCVGEAAESAYDFPYRADFIVAGALRARGQRDCCRKELLKPEPAPPGMCADAYQYLSSELMQIRAGKPMMVKTAETEG